ncbi:MAG: hypothetical protein DRO99_02170 [Candidatus Aenigmatarchaeota archaeon]|nr:MAG: hypothetical protein DRO99_02170 [Candidatus Aenigmarchaeota archaeon]
MEAKKGTKMLQINVIDSGQGKLAINIRRHGFTDPEVIGILEMAKTQVQRNIKTNMEQNSRFKFRPDKKDD